jgi:small subunit ribosomal protein S20
MANTKSAKKRIRQNEKRRMMNRQGRSKMRTEIKKFRSLLSEKKVDEARGMLSSVYGIIDRTVKKGIIHRNTAARYKARLTQRLNEQTAAS